MSTTYRPRKTRDEERGRAFAAKLRAEGKPAMVVCLETISVQFGPAYRINGLKLRAEKLIGMSYGHPEVRARFRFHSQMIVARGLTLDQACALLRDDRTRWSDPAGIAAELHLILRWMRFKRMHKAFAEMVAASASINALEAAE